MNKKKLTVLVTSLALVGMIGIGASLAYMTDNDTATNVITMGHVDVDLTEPNYPGGNKGGEIDNVKPGDNIIKDPTITVQEGSADTFVRVSINITGLTDGQKNQLLETNQNGTYKYFDINLSNWKESEGYFYYVGTYAEGQKAGVLKAGQSVELFKNVKIPSTWGNEMADKSFNIVVKAEAIQADNFDPAELNGVYGWYADGQPVKAETYTQKTVNQ